MQVSYRGIAYQTQPSAIEAIETQEVGLFLGNCFHIKHYTVKQQHSAPLRLRYRGVDYHQ
jgi:Domain of unknown function (DUF4278)